MAPIDEDAPAVAVAAAGAVELLNAATAPEVGYPGLQGAGDVEDVLAALNRLTGDLQQTAAQLAAYLDDELAAGGLAPAAASADEAARTVGTAREALAAVGDGTRSLALLLTRAEAVLLALHRVPAPRPPRA